MSTPGVFGTTVLKSLLNAGHDISVLAVPGPGSKPHHEDLTIPLVQSGSLLDLAHQGGVPVVHLAAKQLEDAEASDFFTLQSTPQPDLILVACFPHILPPDMLALPRMGCLNLHPSLLPAYRGPVPLFWQFRAGEATGGITLHWMTERIDAGDIVFQETMVFPPGISGSVANARLAEAGGRLACDALAQLRTGHELTGQAQLDQQSSYFSWPCAEDFRLDTGWPAERAFRFMRGTEDWGQPYPVRVAGRDIKLKSAIAYSGRGTWGADHLGCALKTPQGQMRIGFSPGVLLAAAG